MTTGNKAAEMMIAPYRTAAERSEEAPACGKAIRVESRSGFVLRRVPCPVPGWLFRTLNGVGIGEVWRCGDCGAEWEWSNRDDSKFFSVPGRHYHADTWRQLRVKRPDAY